VALDEFLLEILVDPGDHGPLLYVENRSLLYNPRRQLAYEVRGAIPVMLDDEARHVDDDEHAQLLADASARTTGSPAT
jgi:uncharacterized protein